MQSQKSLTLGWHSLSEWGSDSIACYFAFEGRQYNGYATQLLNNSTIDLVTRPKIVDTQLMLMVKMR